LREGPGGRQAVDSSVSLRIRLADLILYPNFLCETN
jgi:hypothetical protein